MTKYLRQQKQCWQELRYKLLLLSVSNPLKLILYYSNNRILFVKEALSLTCLGWCWPSPWIHTCTVIPTGFRGVWVARERKKRRKKRWGDWMWFWWWWGPAEPAGACPRLAAARWANFSTTSRHANYTGALKCHLCNYLLIGYLSKY